MASRLSKVLDIFGKIQMCVDNQERMLEDIRQTDAVPGDDILSVLVVYYTMCRKMLNKVDKMIDKTESTSVRRVLHRHTHLLQELRRQMAEIEDIVKKKRRKIP